MTIITPNKRPSERVRDYIYTEYFRQNLPAGTRLPTIHEFAKRLQVSPSTVSTVVNALEKEGKLHLVPGRGTFLTEHSRGNQPVLHHCIGINVAMHPSTDDWAGVILLGATNAALRANMMIMTLDTARMSHPGSRAIEQAISRVDGVIAFPHSSSDTEIREMCQKKNVPLIHINPTTFQATSNFVSADYFGFIYRLAFTWRETGRRRIILLMSGPMEHSISSSQIFSAFSLIFAKYPDVKITILEGDSSGTRETGYRLLKSHLEKTSHCEIDAVYGFGDDLAVGAAQALLESGYKIPKDVSVVSGTGLPPEQVDSLKITSMCQPMQEIGETAVDLLLRHIQNQSRDASAIYLLPTLGEGNTLRHNERQMLKDLLKKKFPIT